MTAKCPSCGYALAKCAAGAHERYAERHRQHALAYQRRKIGQGLCMTCGKRRITIYRSRCNKCQEAETERQRVVLGLQSVGCRYPQRKRHKMKGESE